jgi:uncharacterized protein involved in outer membrane biogenesis
MPLVRKITIGLGAFVIVVIGVLLTIPLFFRSRLEARANIEVNKAVNARVSWNSIGLSLIRDFPNVSLTVNALTVVGVRPFNGDTLLSMRQARLALDVVSVVRYLRSNSKIVVRELAFEYPVMRLRTLGDGTANWDIVRPKQAAGADTGSPLGITLRDLRISNANIAVDDQHPTCPRR